MSRVITSAVRNVAGAFPYRPALAGSLLAVVVSLTAGAAGAAAQANREVQAAGDWTAATRQWVAALQADFGLLPAASANLGRAPEAARDDMLFVLLGARGDSTSRLLAAELLAGWGRADEAWPLLDANLPAEPALAAALLRRFVDRAAATRSRRGSLVRAYALERLASLGDQAQAARVRLEAAQAYADAGDLASAQRMLDRVPGPNQAGLGLAPALASVIRALARGGSPEEAERRLAAWADRLGSDEREELRGAIAWAWVARGELGRAEAILAPDSGLEAGEVRGWIALYRGDLAQARALLAAAGPYTGSREDATRRLGVLVLLERMQADRLPEFGRAMQELARGDTVPAVAGLRSAAERLAPLGGRADLWEFAGELALAHRDYQSAEELLAASLAADSVGPNAPAAQLALAQVAAETGRTELAARQLEHLILAYPESALLPRARRLLDRLRGAVPQ